MLIPMPRLIDKYDPISVVTPNIKIYFYGAGTGASSYSLIGIAALRSLGLEPYCFMDDNHHQYTDGFHGYNVISPEDGIQEIINDPQSSRLIISSNYFKSIMDNITRIAIGDIDVYSLTPFRGIIEEGCAKDLISHSDLDRKLMAHETKAAQYLRHFTSEDALDVPFLDIQLTERCTLRCKDCSNLMQYYSRPVHSDSEHLVLSLERLLDSIDCLREARLLGGEPFLYSDISQVIETLLQSKKVFNIIIYTNGTIIPSPNVIRSLQHPNIIVEITDYGSLSRRRDELVSVFNDHKIRYVCHKPQNWTDSARIVDNRLSEKELIQMYSACCVSDVLTLLHGKLFHCPFSANLFNLLADELPIGEAITVLDHAKDDLREALHSFLYSKQYLEACKRCLGRDFTQPLVEPAIQTRLVLQVPDL